MSTAAEETFLIMRLYEAARRVDVDGTPSQIVSSAELREMAVEADRLARKIGMIRARLLDARDHINGGATNVALVDINRALELSA